MKTTFVLLPIAVTFLFSTGNDLPLRDAPVPFEIPDSVSTPGIDFVNNFNPVEATSSDLFRSSEIWDIHFTFNDSSWQSMQPYGGFYGLYGEPGRWNLGNVLYPTFLIRGDLNYDGEISYEEFMDLGNRWYETWQTDGSDSLSIDELGPGLHESLKLSLQGPKKNGLAPMNGISTPSVFADLEFSNSRFDSVSIRYKGNGTLISAIESNKKPIKIDINDNFPGRKIGGITKLNFHNLIDDPGYINDVIAFQLYRDAGVHAPRTAYASIHFTVPDTLQEDYLGLYLMVENVDKRFMEYRFGSRKGEILKPVSTDLFEYHGEHWNIRYERNFDPKTKLSSAEEQYLIKICKFIQQSNDKEYSKKLDDYFDLDKLARYFAVTAFVSDLDGVLGAWVQNVYIYMDPDTQMLSFMAWDQDHSLGNSWQNFSPDKVEQLSIAKPWIGESLFLDRLFNHDKFSNLYLKYMAQFSQTLFQPERINDMITSIEKNIRPSIVKESEERLAYFDYRMGRDIDTAGLDSVKLSHIIPLKTFISNRHKSIVDQLSGKSEGLTFDNPNNLPPPEFFGDIMLKLTDANHNGLVTKREFVHSFDSLYRAWGGSESVNIEEMAMRDGLDLMLK